MPKKNASDSKPSKHNQPGAKAKQKHAAEQRERSGASSAKASHAKSKFLRGDRIEPRAITGSETAADLIDNAFLAYNAARLREACGLFTKKMLEPDVTVGLTFNGALTPARPGRTAAI